MTFVLKIGVNHHMPLWLSQLPQRTFSSLSSLPDHGWESLTPILITRQGWSELCSFLFPQFNSLSRIWLFVTPWTAASQVSLSFTIPWSLLKLMSNLILKSKEVESISSKIRNKTRMPTLTIFFQHSFGTSSHSSQRRNERNPKWKGRSKTVTVCR